MTKPITIACVLRTGGDFDQEYVERLAAAVDRHCAIPYRFVCLSNEPVPCDRIASRCHLHGWWSKMELFAPWVPGDLLYMDLDTMPVGIVDDLACIGELAIMRDIYAAKNMQSAVMFLPEKERGPVWEAFKQDPLGIMQRCAVGGDQRFLQEVWKDRDIPRIQDLLPGQIVSYKADVQGKAQIPDNARLVVFHGHPRPRDIKWRLPAKG